ncbi:glycoside hydrolase family 88 protein [Leucobacter luti]|uniref:glycoside hydrolase family 88 protein n=1 Tax=Leucobacter luti TaxID=340320 RepID=UPI003CFD68A3
MSDQGERHPTVHAIASVADHMISQRFQLASKRHLKRALKARKLRPDLLFWDVGSLAWGIANYCRSMPGHPGEFRSFERLHRRPRALTAVDHAVYFYGMYDQLTEKQRFAAVHSLKSMPRDAAGSVLYRPQHRAAYLDTIGMITPLLARHGSTYQDAESISLMRNQFEAFTENGYDGASGLPYHGYDLASGQKQGIIGWGRGVGWLLVGLAESLIWLAPGSREFEQAAEAFRSLAEVVVGFQSAQGAFAWQLQCVDGPIDTSAMSMIGFAVMRFSRATGNTDFEPALQALQLRLEAEISESGTVGNSSAECMGFAMYPQKFESNAWGQAYSLLFLTERASPKNPCWM